MVINVAELSTGDLVDFCRWLIDSGNMEVVDVDNVLYFFEKPHKYDEEYDDYLRMRGEEQSA